ncbi:WD40 repeat domain-containing protein [Streptomyces formicae]|uniref:High-affnity carbon uptake protein Hat/HatR n=1 Tax=Streptomyces formicae TaxID=1616117 RepID=A0A291QHL5_9ACTN|nr:WD40 repeat domain-containing protein [Streptomyces formicae]ATL31300.1 High-affnity carbon uptake protein Hat/HatR [Streptomyces formicae]
MGRREKPIDPGAGPVQSFAFALRKLRGEAGTPTYRAMAEGAGYSAAALARAAAGETLPSLALTRSYVRACGGDPGEWERRWRAARDEEAARPRPVDEGPTGSPDAPYRGLARFEPDDHPLFFGRTRLTDSLTALTRAHRCVMLLGPSGSGKSSLLRAGLIPRLRDAEGPAPRPAAIRILTPGPRPAHDHRELFTPAEGPGETWLLVDQFEETFTLCHDAARRREFIDRLLSAEEPGSGLRVVLGMRADFYARCLEHEGLAALLGRASLPVGPMTSDELREVVVKPAAAQGLIVERALTARLVEETRNAPGGLPLLSHTLLETWRRRQGRTLTLRGYEAAGGVHGAVARTAEDLYAGLAPAEAETARHILLRLITPGDGAPDTRRPIDRTELATTRRANPGPDDVLQRLTRARLVTLDGDTVDLAHEALITSWPRLRCWIEDNRERLRRHRRLTAASHNWHERGRDSGALLRGTELGEAEDAFGTPGERDELTAREREFLDCSTRSRRLRTRRGRQLTATLAVLLVLALAATVVAVQRTATADAQRDLAFSREQAARADQLRADRPEAAMVRALRGYRRAPTTEARSSLLSAHARFYAEQFTGHSDSVQSAVFSPDGRTLATASFDHSVKLWDTRSHHLLATLNGHADAVNAVAFSPDGRTLATASNDRGVKLWDARSHRLLATMTGHTNMVEAVVFSPDGRTLASAGGDRTVRLWDVRTHRARAVLTGHGDAVFRLAFSPEGRSLASADTARTTRLWDVASRRTRAVLAGRTGAVTTVAFSPDGRTLATGDRNHHVKLWDVRSRRPRATLTGPTDTVQAVAFSPDGDTLAAASVDGSVRLWDPRSGKALAELTVKRPLYSVVFSPDSKTLVTAGQDPAVRLWDVASHRRTGALPERSGPLTWRVPFAHPRALLTVDQQARTVRWSTAAPRGAPAPIRFPGTVVDSLVSGDGRVLATADRDRTVRVWNLATGKRIITFRKSVWTLRQLSITPDGRTLAAGGKDGTIRVLDTATRRTTAVLRSDRPVTALSLRADGRSVAFAGGGGDGTVRLWDVRSARADKPLPGRPDYTLALSFSPGGRTVAVGGNDGTIRVWDVAGRRVASTLTGHTGPVVGVEFSPDGATLATTSVDRSLRLWRAGRAYATLTGPAVADAATVRFSPDGRALAVIGSRGAARAWSIDADYVAARVCRLGAAHHWARLLPDQPVDDACPS